MLLSLAVTLAVTACQRETAPADASAAAPADAQATREMTLDESKLPPLNQFQLADLDTSKNACTDFAGYANAKFLAAHPIPGDRTSWGAFEMLDERSTAIQHQLAEQAAADANAGGVEKLVGDFWATGMDEAKINAEGIEPLRDELARIDALADSAAIAAWLRETAARGQGFLIGVGSMPDFKDSSINIAATGQGGLGLPDTPYYKDADKQDIREAYVAHIAKVLELSGVPAADAATQAEHVMAFETRLAAASKSRAEFSRDVSLYYNPMPVADADKLTPNFSWTQFFEAQGVEQPETFSVSVPDYFREVDAMLADVPVEQWKSYLRFHVVDSASPYLSDAFVQQNYEFYNKTLSGQKELEPRWKRVLGTIDGQVGEAMGQLYVKVAFPPESKAKMEALIANLSEALKVRIENLEWMSPETKTRALEKWATFEPRVGYPDKWREWNGLATGRDSYLDNVLAATEFNYKWDLSKIGQPVDKTEWGMRPQTVNASYNPLANQLTFPAAILQPPFFDPDATEELNYGGIGAVIGHEMTHGYDDQGSRFDAKGTFLPDPGWWTQADFDGFRARTGKLVAQFDGYKTDDGRNLNGTHTLGENIADLGGLATAYDAMKKATAGTPDPMTDGLTRDQRFFLNWATVWRRNFTPEELSKRLVTDEHALAGFRAIGAPSNLPAFAAAFDCKPGDAMVRGGEEQVVIW
ncbi:M13 family metallopeptidase [Luteimonas kalidii]|uniref:M13-type metalloendopeptidase n=1 Tax=Luteimonas kalidii TaxID=3042025 RepID=A0ABT6JYJ5_9GAMM|nr:M13-type metalloendopeptidase [Luteimonas kalidii]MDH5835664.1 M13-type metalloendopeptidase [Luteimonas kalidii]